MKLNPDKVPCNLDEAVELLKEASSIKEQGVLKKMESNQLHHSLGTVIRNEWSLWYSDTIIVQWFKRTYKLDHADDLSGIIIECFLNDLNEVKRRDKILAKQYIAHWKQANK